MNENHDICEGKHRGAETSVKAFHAGRRDRQRQKLRVLDVVRLSGKYGATTFEVSESLNMCYTAASARMSELKRDKKIVESGKTRPTGTGRQAKVLVMPAQKELF